MTAHTKDPIWQAVGCARTLMRYGVPAALAISRAARKYDVDVSEVARRLGQRGGRARRRS